TPAFPIIPGNLNGEFVRAHAGKRTEEAPHMVREATKTLWPTTATTTDDATTATVWFKQPQMDVASCTPEESVGAYDRLQTYGMTPQRQEKIDTRYFKMPAEERDAKINALREQLGSRLTILGHHYQR